MALNVTSLDELAGIVAGLQDRIGALESKIAADEVSINVGWTLLTGFLVFCKYWRTNPSYCGLTS